jgi:hypothetical protein
VRELPEIHTSTARNPELPPGAAVLGIDPPAENCLSIQPTRAQEEHRKDSYYSHLPEAIDERSDPAVTALIPCEVEMCFETTDSHRNSAPTAYSITIRLRAFTNRAEKAPVSGMPTIRATANVS